MFYVVLCIMLFYVAILMSDLADYLLHRLGERDMFFLLLITRTLNNHVVSVQRSSLFLCVLGKGCVILLWHSLGLSFK